MSEDSSNFAAPWATAPETNPAPVEAPVTEAAAPVAPEAPESAPVTPENTADTAQSEPAPTVAPEVPESAPKAEDDSVYVTVTVPRAFRFWVNPHKEAVYQPGVQEMPLEHAEHWYSRANGVVIYTPKKPA